MIGLACSVEPDGDPEPYLAYTGLPGVVVIVAGLCILAGIAILCYRARRHHGD